MPKTAPAIFIARLMEKRDLWLSAIVFIPSCIGRQTFLSVYSPVFRISIEIRRLRRSAALPSSIRWN
jgi:hypothetical protein